MTTTNPPSSLDLDNIQGDILAGFPKKTETYILFQVGDDVDQFRTQLAQLVPLVTSTTAVVDDRDSISENKKTTAPGQKPSLVPTAGFNIAFSQLGLTKIGITDDIGDDVFSGGQLDDAEDLGDPGTMVAGKFSPNWDPAFKQPIHGLILIAGDSQATVNTKLSQIEAILRVGEHDATIHEVLRIIGNVRPEKDEGHEHFGFKDGISNPAVRGFDTSPNPGQGFVDANVILVQDDGQTTRPPWAIDGSFLAFRYLLQLVPEFNDFLSKNPILSGGRTPEQGSEFLGARLVGRWKSGAPLDLTPDVDDPVLADDPLKNNNFNYDFPGDFEDQTRCPFAAHIRKTNPRNDIEQDGGSVEPNRIIRRGIQFGPEVTSEEARDNTTRHERGLLFACYQSNLSNGFQFIQKSWANNTSFPFKRGSEKPGFDPIIGQSGDISSRNRTITGTDPIRQTQPLSLFTDWVVPRGGEYFFSPSISALRDTFALGAHTR